jgi:hypothetical protein
MAQGPTAWTDLQWGGLLGLSGSARLLRSLLFRHLYIDFSRDLPQLPAAVFLVGILVIVLNLSLVDKLASSCSISLRVVLTW